MNQSTRLKEVAVLFARLGFTAFGGPAAHVAMIEDEVVARRKWIDRQHFLDLVATVNFVPGPNSTELAIHLGLIRAGFAGLVTAGVCFITPAVLIILPLAWAYVHFGSKPRVEHVMSSINAAVIAIVAAATWRFAQVALKDRFTGIVGVVAVAAGVLGRRFVQLEPDLFILATAAIAGAIYYGRPRLPAGGPLPLVLPPALGGPDWQALGRMALIFLKIGATLFGSGYVLISYLQHDLVDQLGWLNQRELLDAISVGQITPGPLLTTATFIGYLLGERFVGGIGGGIAGGMLATAAIFLPSFVFIAILGRVLPRIRANRFARGALDAVNAAVVALLLLILLRLCQTTFVPDGHVNLVNIVVTVVTLTFLTYLRLSTLWLIAGAAIVGLAKP